ncbi:hypothetical protein ADUPG1_009961, partial [Aduncisulcus paluster]
MAKKKQFSELSDGDEIEMPSSSYEESSSSEIYSIEQLDDEEESDSSKYRVTDDVFNDGLTPDERRKLAEEHAKIHIVDEESSSKSLPNFVVEEGEETTTSSVSSTSVPDVIVPRKPSKPQKRSEFDVSSSSDDLDILFDEFDEKVQSRKKSISHLSSKKRSKETQDPHSPMKKDKKSPKKKPTINPLMTLIQAEQDYKEQQTLERAAIAVETHNSDGDMCQFFVQACVRFMLSDLSGPDFVKGIISPNPLLRAAMRWMEVIDIATDDLLSTHWRREVLLGLQHMSTACVKRGSFEYRMRQYIDSIVEDVLNKLEEEEDEKIKDKIAKKREDEKIQEKREKKSQIENDDIIDIDDSSSHKKGEERGKGEEKDNEEEEEEEEGESSVISGESSDTFDGENIFSCSRRIRERFTARVDRLISNCIVGRNEKDMIGNTPEIDSMMRKQKIRTARSIVYDIDDESEEEKDSIVEDVLNKLEEEEDEKIKDKIAKKREDEKIQEKREKKSQIENDDIIDIDDSSSHKKGEERGKGEEKDNEEEEEEEGESSVISGESSDTFDGENIFSCSRRIRERFTARVDRLISNCIVGRNEKDMIGNTPEIDSMMRKQKIRTARSIVYDIDDESEEEKGRASEHWKNKRGSHGMDSTGHTKHTGQESNASDFGRDYEHTSLHNLPIDYPHLRGFVRDRVGCTTTEAAHRCHACTQKGTSGGVYFGLCGRVYNPFCLRYWQMDTVAFPKTSNSLKLMEERERIGVSQDDFETDIDHAYACKEDLVETEFIGKCKTKRPSTSSRDKDDSIRERETEKVIKIDDISADGHGAKDDPSRASINDNNKKYIPSGRKLPFQDSIASIVLSARSFNPSSLVVLRSTDSIMEDPIVNIPLSPLFPPCAFYFYPQCVRAVHAGRHCAVRMSLYHRALHFRL